MLHRATSEQTFEEGSVVAVDLLELLSGGGQRYVYRTREALMECATDGPTASNLLRVTGRVAWRVSRRNSFEREVFYISI